MVFGCELLALGMQPRHLQSFQLTGLVELFLHLNRLGSSARHSSVSLLLRYLWLSLTLISPLGGS